MTKTKLFRVFTNKLRGLGVRAIFAADTIERSGWSAFLRNPLKSAHDRPADDVASASSRRNALPSSDAPQIDAQAVCDTLFVGYAEGALGLGQAFRNNLKAAETAGLSFSVHPVTKGIENRLIGPFMQDRYDFERVHKINIIEAAVDQIPLIQDDLGARRYKDSYNIIRPYWELPRAPEEWRPYLESIDEIWAPNQFIADAFVPIFDGPIVIIPPTIEDLSTYRPGNMSSTRVDGHFHFMFSFDYNSSPFRKNPLAVIEAFGSAFPNKKDKVRLIIKTNGESHLFPDMRNIILLAAAQDKRIILLESHIDREEMKSLLYSSDAYISLHRAEGFGLGMVEAMALGVFVIGTNFSGSMDFLNTETGFPIPYRLVPIKEFEYPWSLNQCWAEPDHEAAVAAMRHLYANADRETDRLTIARKAVLRKYNRDAVGKKIRDRIEYLLRDRSHTQR